MCVALAVRMHSVHCEYGMHDTSTVYALAIRLVVVCMYHTRKSNSAMPPLSSKPTGTISYSTSSNTTRRPCGGSRHCLHNIGVLCMYTHCRSALCHSPHTHVSHMHIISVGQTSPVVLFGGMTTTSPSDEASVDACHRIRLLHTAHRGCHRCAGLHIHTPTPSH